MPYIAAEERPALDKKVDALAKALASEVGRRRRETEVSVCYREAFAVMGRTVRALGSGRKMRAATEAEKLAVEICSNSKEQTAWLGRLNYSVTTLIQKVPKELVARGAWKEEFRYWLYAETVGALERAALEAHEAGGGSVTDGLVGVFVDVKDEFKRRVNSAYEAVQIAKSGDCYTTPYRTELTEVNDAKGRLVGYQEVMKDFRQGATAAQTGGRRRRG